MITAATCGSFSTSAKVALILERTAGSRTVPFFVANTIVSRSPACAGKLFCSRSAARWASELGSVKLLEYSVPADCAKALTPTSRTIQPIRTYLRWVVDQRASLSMVKPLEDRGRTGTRAGGEAVQGTG